MNTAERFFRRYIFSTIRIIALFFAVNVLLAGTFFFIAYLNGVADSNFPIEDFSDHVTALNGKMACRKNCHINTPRQISQCLASGIWTIIP